MSQEEKIIRVLLVDDSPLFRSGIVALLNQENHFEVIGEASNGEEGLHLCRAAAPDIVLMDIQMPGMGGLEATRQILQAFPAIKIIMLTVSEREADLFEAIKAGAQGYMIKTVINGREMRAALQRVAAGGVIIPTEMAPRLLAEFANLAKSATEKQPNPARPVSEKTINPTASDTLTEREIDVLQLVAEGLANKEIAARLVISENTVRAHLRAIMDKLHTSNRVQAALWLTRQK